MQSIGNAVNNAAKEQRITKLKIKLFDKYYEKLNERQREAVTTVNGSTLVLAGAGSGKTTVLVSRIAHILSFGDAYASDFVPSGADESKMEELLKKGERDEIGEYLRKFAVNVPKPWQILCITFTNKAANEFKERLEKLLGEAAGDIWAGTFHSICVRILRRHIAKLGFDNHFSIYDSDDSKKLITECMKRLGIAEDKLTPKSVQNEINRSKERFITAESYENSAGSDIRKQQIAKVYKEYQKELKKASALDFDDLIFNTLMLFTSNPDVLQTYKEQFHYILADEYQDTNHSQNLLIEMLGSDRGNVCVVGDDDQSIYAFRGATIDNILNFDRVFRDTKIIRLEQNYRSTQTILDAANGLIKNNTGRKGKTLWTENEEGEKILIKKHFTQSEEALYIMNVIRKRVAEGEAKFSDFAILYRLNEQSNAIEMILSKNHIPYRIYGGQRFYDRKEIKDIIAYMCVASNTNDETRLRRIINLPRRNIGTTAMAVLSALVEREGKSSYEILLSIDEYPELNKFKVPFKTFTDLIEELRYLANNQSLSDFVESVIEKSGYRKMLEESLTESDRLKNVEELVSSAVLYEQSSETKSLSSFLEEIALVSEIDNYDKESDAVAMMTMHSAKGLEFPVVFLPGFEDGVFPSMQSISGEDLEEERRLAYVGLTRAKNQLIITHTKTRLLYGRTTSNPISRFVSEIPKEFVELEDLPKSDGRGVPAYVANATTKSAESFLRKTQRADEHMTATEQLQKTVRGHTKPEFSEGDRVLHMGFGEGTVLEAEQMGPDVIYTVEFDKQGKRKLMASYAKLKLADADN